jgi:hypothetical protein
MGCASGQRLEPLEKTNDYPNDGDGRRHNTAQIEAVDAATVNGPDIGRVLDGS